MSYTILVVDDEVEIANLIETYLKNEDYTVVKYYSSKEALSNIHNQTFDLAILDIMLPEIDGFELCQKIREHYAFPIIMLTAKDNEMDKITGLTFGADDYITKPFRPLELLARVKSQLRRYKKYNAVGNDHQSDGVLIYSDLVVDVKKHLCLLNNNALSLTPTEFLILQILLENKGKVISAEDLFHRIWQDEYYNKATNTITVHIRRLREKLDDSLEESKYIKTIWGVGYKIEE